MTADPMPSRRPRRWAPRARPLDTILVLVEVVLPTIAKGPLLRRPAIVALVERLGLDARAVRRVERLRARYGRGPLLVRIPLRRYAIVLEPDDVETVLGSTPDPFSPVTAVKRGALRNLEPHGVLNSIGNARADRRPFNEAVLDYGQEVHGLGARFDAVVAEEAQMMLADARGELRWPDFAAAWYRLTRRIVLGDGARDDTALFDLLNALRADAQLRIIGPRRDELREQFFDRLERHLERYEPGSLAAVVARTPSTPVTQPAQQVPQWLFAYDAAGIATFRALALLAAHTQAMAAARAEVDARPQHAGERRYLRACVMEALRLWPTTPLILRETTRTVDLPGGLVPRRAGVLVFAPYFHRDRGLADADRFTPARWLGGSRETALVPFSAGPAACPGQDLVRATTSAMLGAILGAADVRLVPPDRLDARRPMPGTLNNYGLRFRLASR